MSGVSPFYVAAGQLLHSAHRAFQFIGRVYAGAVYPPVVEDRPAPEHSRAWVEFQAQFAQRKDAERAKHGKIRQIEAEQAAAVNAALRGRR